MMKRMLILLAALLLLCLPAGAEEDVYDRIENALYRIVLRTQEGDVSLGSGVLFMDEQVLLTAQSCCMAGSLYAIGTDGEHAILGAQMLGDSGTALLELATPSAHAPLTLANDDATGLACLFGVDAQGEPGLVPLYQVRQGMYRDQEALLASAAEGMLPGSFMADDKGSLIGLSVAQQAEGMGVYICLDANALYAAMTRQQYADVFLPVEMAWDNGLLTLSWQDEKRSSGLYLITISGAENSYYTFYEADHADRSIDLSVPPGHDYDIQVQWTESAEAAIEPVWALMVEYAVPKGAFAEYAYQQDCALVTKAGEESAQPLTAPTAASLTDAAHTRYLQVTASYDVPAVTELNMTIELIAPDGQFYYESAVCTLTPAREKKDVFLLPVDDLLADCMEFSGGALQPGAYILRYALEGGTAGEYAFTLAAEGEEITLAPAVSGFATDVTAEYKDGLITLAWSADGIPEGAVVNAFYVYDGNTYYIYHRMEPGETSTEIFTIPGRNVMAWVVWTTDESTAPLMPQTQADYVLIPAAEEAPLTLNGFANHRLSVVPSDDPAAAEKGEYLPPVTLTREILADRDTPLYFQTEDTYQIAQTSEDHPMAVVLCTPEGLCFIEPGLYIFDVTLQQSDLWLKDVSALFADYESMVVTRAWPSGEYRILYCIDGQVAGEFTFTLE